MTYNPHDPNSHGTYDGDPTDETPALRYLKGVKIALADDSMAPSARRKLAVDEAKLALAAADNATERGYIEARLREWGLLEEVTG